jgi:hypothetical protein
MKAGETQAFYPEYAEMSAEGRQRAIAGMEEWAGREYALNRQVDAAHNSMKFYLFGEGSPIKDSEGRAIKGTHPSMNITPDQWARLSKEARIGLMYKANTLGQYGNDVAKSGNSAAVLDWRVGEKNPTTKIADLALRRQQAYEGNPAFHGSGSKDNFTIRDMVNKVREVRSSKGFKPWAEALDKVLRKDGGP